MLSTERLRLAENKCSPGMPIPMPDALAPGLSGDVPTGSKAGTNHGRPTVGSPIVLREASPIISTIGNTISPPWQGLRRFSRPEWPSRRSSIASTLHKNVEPREHKQQNKRQNIPGYRSAVGGNGGHGGLLWCIEELPEQSPALRCRLRRCRSQHRCLSASSISPCKKLAR